MSEPVTNSTKEHILEKSFILFLKKSYGSVSMDNIQDETNLSRGAIYHHFRGKDEILKEVINHYFFPLLSVVRSSDTYIDSNTPLKDAIQDLTHVRAQRMNMLRSITETNIEDFYFFKLAFQAEEFYPNFKEKVEKIQKAEAIEWVKILTLAKSKGEVKMTTDIEMSATIFMIIPQGIGMNSLFGVGLTIETLKGMYDRFYNSLL